MMGPKRWSTATRQCARLDKGGRAGADEQAREPRWRCRVNRGGTALNTNTPSDKSSQPVNVEPEQPAVTRRSCSRARRPRRGGAWPTPARLRSVPVPLSELERSGRHSRRRRFSREPRCALSAPASPARPDQGAGRARPPASPCNTTSRTADRAADRGHAAAGLGRLRPVVQLGQDRLGRRGLPAGRRHALAAMGERFSADQSRQDQRRGQGRRRRRAGAAPLRPARRLAPFRPDRAGLDAALTHNVDAFGYQSEVVDSEDAKSWAIFYDTDYKGKVGLPTIPQPVSWTWPSGRRPPGSPPSTTSAT